MDDSNIATAFCAVAIAVAIAIAWYNPEPIDATQSARRTIDKPCAVARPVSAVPADEEAQAEEVPRARADSVGGRTEKGRAGR